MKKKMKINKPWEKYNDLTLVSLLPIVMVDSSEARPGCPAVTCINEYMIALNWVTISMYCSIFRRIQIPF